MDEYKQVITGAALVLGVFIPILMLIANRALRDNDNKVEKLFTKCDAMERESTLKAIQIAKLEEAVVRLDKVAEKCQL